MKMEEKMENHREDKGKKYAQMKEKDAHVYDAKHEEYKKIVMTMAQKIKRKIRRESIW